MKYVAVSTWLSCLYGGSTGLAPIHVSRDSVEMIVARISFLCGWNFLDWIWFFFRVGSIMIISDMISAMIPPTFDGIDRRIA